MTDEQKRYFIKTVNEASDDAYRRYKLAEERNDEFMSRYYFGQDYAFRRTLSLFQQALLWEGDES